MSLYKLGLHAVFVGRISVKWHCDSTDSSRLSFNSFCGYTTVRPRRTRYREPEAVRNSEVYLSLGIL